MSIALIWLLIVDRSSILGTLKNPEHSIENDWIRRATERTFFAALGLFGVSATITGVLG